MNNQNTDIVERLRRGVNSTHHPIETLGGMQHSVINLETADLIESQQAQIVELETRSAASVKGNMDAQGTIAELQNKVAELEDELKMYREGYKGSCYCCEVVGELNVKLEKRLKAYEESNSGR